MVSIYLWSLWAQVKTEELLNHVSFFLFLCDFFFQILFLQQVAVSGSETVVAAETYQKMEKQLII